MSKLTIIPGQKLTRNFGSNMLNQFNQFNQFGLNLTRRFLECRFRLVCDFHLAANVHANELQVNVYPYHPSNPTRGREIKQIIHSLILRII